MNPMSGYIELKMGDTTLPFKFGSNAYGLFCAMHGLEFWQLSESGVFGRTDDKGELISIPDFGKLRDLFFCAHQSAMRSKGESEMINLYAFGDLLDETEGAVTRLQEAMMSARMMGFELGSVTEVKKK